MRLLEGSETFEGCDLRRAYSADRSNTRANRFALDNHGAGSALTETATELRPAQREIVAQHVQQRCRRVYVHGVSPAVDFQVKYAHCSFLPGTDKFRCKRIPLLAKEGWLRH